MSRATAPSCDRCRKRYRGRGAWNGITQGGVLVGVLCPACQTPEENAEAEINNATVDLHPGPFGLLYSTPKGETP